MTNIQIILTISIALNALFLSWLIYQKKHYRYSYLAKRYAVQCLALKKVLHPKQTNRRNQ